MQIKILNIFQGKSIEYKKNTKEYKSAYKKEKTNQSIFVSFLGLEEDIQADDKLHGGVDRAVCVYTKETYDFLKKRYNLDLPECSFGENITLASYNDENIYLGDIFSCGEAIFEVSQPRLPCWKISDLTKIKNLTSLVVKEAKTGFFLRVLKEGIICKEDNLILTSRLDNTVSISQISHCYYNAKDNQEIIKNILSLDVLAKDYKQALEKRYKYKSFGIDNFQEDK